MKRTIEYEESKKAQLTLDFIETVLLPHIKYSNKQYGDSDVDIVSTWSAKDCLTNIERYIRRFGKNQRSGQEKLDIVKCVDYLIRMYYKDDVEDSKSKEQILLERIWNENICEDEFGSDLFNDIKCYFST